MNAHQGEILQQKTHNYTLLNQLQICLILALHISHLYGLMVLYYWFGFLILLTTYFHYYQVPLIAYAVFCCLPSLKYDFTTLYCHTNWIMAFHLDSLFLIPTSFDFRHLLSLAKESLVPFQVCFPCCLVDQYLTNEQLIAFSCWTKQHWSSLFFGEVVLTKSIGCGYQGLI